jgi:hypothetical protein
VRIRILALLAVAGAVVAGCATVHHEAELEKRLERLGAATQGLRRPRTAVIHADTRVAALGLLAEARANRDSPLSASLARQLASAKRSHRDLVAGGPFADLTEQVLRNALALQEDGSLEGLQLLVASQEQPSSTLLVAARRTRVRLLYRAFR